MDLGNKGIASDLFRFILSFLTSKEDLDDMRIASDLDSKNINDVTLLVLNSNNNLSFSTVKKIFFLKKLKIYLNDEFLVFKRNFLMIFSNR